MNTLFDIWLKELPHMSSKTKIHLVKCLGESENVYHASKGTLENIEGINKDIINSILLNKDLNKAKNIYDTMKEEEIKGIAYYNKSYPSLLKEIFNPPFLFYMKGELMEADQKAIAIVGARKATAYGKWAAYNIAYQLGEYNTTVISGMAFGADTFAHQGVLDSNGRSIAVLACGLDICYPKSNYKLMKKIIEKGAVISEYAPGTPPLPGFFPARNRIISGLSQGVVVVEAGLKSGSLITAEYALEQGRDVYAVPGNIESIYSKGTNKLILEGATPIIGIKEFLSELNLIVGQKELSEEVSLGTHEKALINILKNKDSTSIDLLIQELNSTPSDINALLTVLEIKGLVQVMPGKIVIAK